MDDGLTKLVLAHVLQAVRGAAAYQRKQFLLPKLLGGGAKDRTAFLFALWEAPSKNSRLSLAVQFLVYCLPRQAL